MTHRVTLDVPATFIQYGIPYVTSDDANSTLMINDIGDAITWCGVQIDHAPEPGTPGTASLAVHKQSDSTKVAEVLTSGTVYLYYPNSPEYANANLSSNQGTCEWDTYYYLEVTPNTPTPRRENIAIRKITITSTQND